MYKVFFDDRVVYLSERAPDGRAGTARSFMEFQGRPELGTLLDSFASNDQLQELHVFHKDLAELSAAFISCFKFIEAGGGVVLNEKGEFLAIERNGVWDLPKGKMEKGEDFETTALREVEEETGLAGLELSGLLLSTFHTYPLKGKMILKETRWFEMLQAGGGEPVLQAEEGITAYRWVKPGNTGFIRKNTYASILDVLRVKKLL